MLTANILPLFLIRSLQTARMDPGKGRLPAGAPLLSLPMLHLLRLPLPTEAHDVLHKKSRSARHFLFGCFVRLSDKPLDLGLPYSDAWVSGSKPYQLPSGIYRLSSSEHGDYRPEYSAFVLKHLSISSHPFCVTTTPSSSSVSRTAITLPMQSDSASSYA